MAGSSEAAPQIGETGQAQPGPVEAGASSARGRQRRALRGLDYEDQGAALAPAEEAGVGSPEAIATRGLTEPGRPLPAAGRLEAATGIDFSGVSAHFGPAATAACEALGAEAYTLGDAIAFATASPGLALQAHEAAHTIQQGAVPAPPAGSGEAGGDPEQQADGLAAAVVAGDPAARQVAGSQPRVGRQVQREQYKPTAEGLAFKANSSTVCKDGQHETTKEFALSFGEAKVSVPIWGVPITFSGGGKVAASVVTATRSLLATGAKALGPKAGGGGASEGAAEQQEQFEWCKVGLGGELALGVGLDSDTLLKKIPMLQKLVEGVGFELKLDNKVEVKAEATFTRAMARMPIIVEAKGSTDLVFSLLDGALDYKIGLLELPLAEFEFGYVPDQGLSFDGLTVLPQVQEALRQFIEWLMGAPTRADEIKREIELINETEKVIGTRAAELVGQGFPRSAARSIAYYERCAEVTVTRALMGADLAQAYRDALEAPERMKQVEAAKFAELRDEQHLPEDKAQRVAKLFAEAAGEPSKLVYRKGDRQFTVPELEPNEGIKKHKQNFAEAVELFEVRRYAFGNRGMDPELASQVAEKEVRAQDTKGLFRQSSQERQQAGDEAYDMERAFIRRQRIAVDAQVEVVKLLRQGVVHQQGVIAGFTASPASGEKQAKGQRSRGKGAAEAKQAQQDATQALARGAGPAQVELVGDIVREALQTLRSRDTRLNLEMGRGHAQRLLTAASEVVPERFRPIIQDTAKPDLAQILQVLETAEQKVAPWQE